MLNFEINRFDDYNEVIENILDENSSKIILFNGDLGSGKTTLIQLICKKLKIKEKVLSPTFNLINEYQINNDFKVYHFGSLTTRKKKNLIQNRGDKTFLKKWGISTKFFKKHYLKSKTKYDGPLKEPNITPGYIFGLLSCKIQSIFLLY